MAKNARIRPQTARDDSKIQILTCGGAVACVGRRCEILEGPMLGCSRLRDRGGLSINGLGYFCGVKYCLRILSEISIQWMLD